MSTIFLLYLRRTRDEIYQSTPEIPHEVKLYF